MQIFQYDWKSLLYQIHIVSNLSIPFKLICPSKIKKADSLEILLGKIKSSIKKTGARRLNYLKEKEIGVWLAATLNNLCGKVFFGSGIQG